MIVCALAIAAIGVYLIVVGVIALIAWLTASAIKSRNAATTQPPLTTGSITPSFAAPPEHQYHVALPVDPAVFDSQAALESTTKSVFTAWARQLPMAPRDPSDAIRSMSLHRRLIGRLTTKLDGRRFVWRSAPYRGRDRMVSARPINPATLDPNFPPDDLRSRSSCLELCQSCRGEGRMECTSCGGAGRVTCAECRGAGKVDGVTKSGARRLLNCKACKGKSTLSCHACKNGQLGCPSCRESGRVEHWLEVEGGPRDADVQVEPDGDVTRAFVWGKDGVTASHDEVMRDARVVCAVARDHQLTLADLPDEVPSEWRNAHWLGIQAKLHQGEQIIAQSFALLEVPSVEVTYALGSSSANAQSIEFEGLRMLAPPVSVDQQFRSRAASLKRLAYGLGAIPVLVAFVYLIRGSYFATSTTAAIVLCSAIAAAVIYGVIRKTSLGRPAWAWLGAATLPVATAAALAITGEPSADAARKYIDANRLDLASVELAALGAPKDTGLWADIHLKDTLAEISCPRATTFAFKISTNSPQREKAQAHADALAVAAAERALTAGNLPDATSALSCASESTRNGPASRSIQARIKIAEANACLKTSDWTCAFDRATAAKSFGATAEAEKARETTLAAIRTEVDGAVARAEKEKDLRSRVAAQQKAIDLWMRYLLSEKRAEPTELAALKTVAKKDQDALAKADQIAAAKRAVEEKRQAEIAAREEKRQAAAQKREEAAERRREQQEESRSCCKVCSTGCPCGDSCISCSKTCRKGRGCAC